MACLSEAKMTTRSWPCPVCGYIVFDGPPGTYEMCGVCGWEDDSVQVRHPRMRGGANGGSIFDYQKDHSDWVTPDQFQRDPGWRPLASTEAVLPSGQEGEVDYALNYYGDLPPYYWRS